LQFGAWKKSDEKVSFGKRAMEICDREKKNEKLNILMKIK
jgi:hypothetical protein